MSETRIDERSKPLRLWPGVFLVTAQWLIWLVLPRVVIEPIVGYISAFSALLGGIAIAIWWAFFSRAPRIERFGGVGLMALALFGARGLLDPSIATGGMGLLFFVYAVPFLCLALLIWAFVSRRWSRSWRLASMAATIFLACLAWTLLRTDGVSAEGSHFAWRWSMTAEERLLAEAGDRRVGPPEAGAAEVLPIGAEWPGFRGPNRDGVVGGAVLDTDWEGSPPTVVWRRAVGPGWSSFAVQGELFYTQEQRGDEEIVACYRTATGEPVWRHSDAARFWESNAGPGPRGTPALDDGRVYALGATGILSALDAADGSVLWSRDVSADTGTKVPVWGFSSSPLVVGEVVVVAAAGRLAAYDRRTGDPSWLGPDHGGGYSSPHLVEVDGVGQVVLLSAAGATGVEPATGAVLWEHPWPGGPIVQPALLSGGDLLVTATPSSGLRRLAIAHGAARWTVEERWTSTGLKPNFNDYVVHEGHAYGFDGSILAAIALDDGRRVWKGGRYGQGQLVLLRDADALLVISERGELALVAAAPDGFEELARSPGIEGKTWNHPVVIRDLLLVRNGEEMAAFQLPVASD